MSATTAGELARIVYENKSALGLDSGFATQIEPASVEKDAYVMAHQGAADYINDDTKSFMDKYSDMMYLGAAALSVIGSIFAAIYTKITGSRRRRQRAFHRRPRHRRTHRARPFAGPARMPAGRAGGHLARRGDRLA